MSKAFLAVALTTKGLTLGVGVGVGVGVGDGVGVAAGAVFLTATPLLQINLLPFFIQVYFIPAEVLTWPFFLHIAPDLIAAVAEKTFNPETRQAIKMAARARFMLKE